MPSRLASEVFTTPAIFLVLFGLRATGSSETDSISCVELFFDLGLYGDFYSSSIILDLLTNSSEMLFSTFSSFAI